MSDPKLLPCPFCGDTGPILYATGFAGVLDPFMGHQVECTGLGCGARVFAHDPHNAADQWNRRAIFPEHGDLWYIKRLTESLGALEGVELWFYWKYHLTPEQFEKQKELQRILASIEEKRTTLHDKQTDK